MNKGSLSSDAKETILNGLFKGLGGKLVKYPNILLPVQIYFKDEGKIKTFFQAAKTELFISLPTDLHYEKC